MQTAGPQTVIKGLHGGIHQGTGNGAAGVVLDFKGLAGAVAGSKVNGDFRVEDSFADGLVEDSVDSGGLHQRLTVGDTGFSYTDIDTEIT